MKNNIEKLMEILEDFDEDSISEAYDRIQNGDEIYRVIDDDKDTSMEIEVDGSTVLNFEDMPAIERIVEDNNLLPVYFLEVGAIKEKSVARIVISSGGRATGFLISPSILLTNNHVFGSKNSAKNAKIQFNYQKEADGTSATVDEYTTDPDSLFYTNSSLDFSIVRVAPRCPVLSQTYYHDSPEYDFNECMGERAPNSLNRLPSRPDLMPNFPDWWRPPIRFCNPAGQKWGFIPLQSNPTYALEQLVNVIQHPAGRQKEIALQKNQITNIYSTRIRYKTDTQRGSSGSPVFNNRWELIALHHAGGERDSAGNWISNQGIRIDEIVENLRNNFNDTDTGRGILTELGIAV